MLVPSADTNKVVFRVRSVGKGRQPLDPYCLKELCHADIDTNIGNYLNSIGIGSSNDVSTAISNLKGYGFSNVSDTGFEGTPSNADVKWQMGQKVLDSMGVSCENAYGVTMDLDYDNTPFSGMRLTQVLTDSQMEALETMQMFPGVEYDERGNKNQYKSCRYWAPKTTGFYQLRNTLRNLSETYNIYLMVSDANAPKPLTNDNTTGTSIFMWHEKDLFSEDGELGGINLPTNVNDVVKGITGKSKQYTYNTLFKTNCAYWWNMSFSGRIDDNLKWNNN